MCKSFKFFKKKQNCTRFQVILRNFQQLQIVQDTSRVPRKNCATIFVVFFSATINHMLEKYFSLNGLVVLMVLKAFIEQNKKYEKKIHKNNEYPGAFTIKIQHATNLQLVKAVTLVLLFKIVGVVNFSCYKIYSLFKFFFNIKENTAIFSFIKVVPNFYYYSFCSTRDV